MNNEALVGKKILIGVHNESVAVLCSILPNLYNTFKTTEIVVCRGHDETINRILKETPDVVLLHFDQDSSFKPVIDIQLHIHQAKLDCKVIVYSRHPFTAHRHAIEAAHKLLFMDLSDSPEKLFEVISFCLQSKSKKILIAMSREAAINYLRLCINAEYPGHHIMYEISPIKAYATVVHECPDLVIVDLTSLLSWMRFDQKETYLFLERVRAIDKFKTNPPILIWGPFEHLSHEFLIRGATAFQVWSDHLSHDEVKRRLEPYLGNAHQITPA